MAETAQAARPQPPAAPLPAPPQAKAALPLDIAALYQETGIRAFIAVPIGANNAAPMGALLVGSRQPRGFAANRHG